MSEFRVEKHRAEAELTLATGTTLHGWFFLAESSAIHQGPERVADLLNTEGGFVPFDIADGDQAGHTVLVNRSQVVSVRLLESTPEAQLEPGYAVATARYVHILLSNGVALAGAVRVYRPIGRDRLSDWARAPEKFRYLENAGGKFVVNSAHIVELREALA